MVIYRTIHKIVTDDPKLVKKTARWVLRLLDKGQKEERVRCYQQLKDLVTGDEAILKRIVCHHRWDDVEPLYPGKQGPEPPVATQGPVRACECQDAGFQEKMDDSGIFFYCEGLICTSIADAGEKVNAGIIVVTFKIFLKRLGQKDWHFWTLGTYFFRRTMPIYTLISCSRIFFAKKSIKMIEYPPYSTDLAPA